MKRAVPFLWMYFLLACCTRREVDQQPVSPVLFEKLDARETGVMHFNTILQTETMNFFSWKYIYNGGGVALGDINNDGWVDIYLTSNLYSAKLYLNRGDFTFEEISQQAGVTANEGYKTGVAMADVNGDGYLDIYVCRDAFADENKRNNLLYINNGDLTFTESASKYGLDDQAYSTQAYFFDFDLDHDLDLYLVNHPGDMHQSVTARLRDSPGGKTRYSKYKDLATSDRLFRNDGDTFTDISVMAGVTNYTFGLSAAITDMNEDGYPDLYIANDFFEPDQVLINDQNARFTDQTDTYFKHMTNSSMGSDFGDINNDGREDLLVVDMQPQTHYRKQTLATPMSYNTTAIFIDYGYKQQVMRNMLHLNTGGNSFSEIGQLTGLSETDWSWGALIFDMDNDSQNDIFISNGISKDMSNLDYMQFKLDSIQKAEARQQYAVNLENWDQWIDFIPSNKLRNFAFQNLGNLAFEEVSEHWGFTQKTFSNGIAYADLDNDGDLDLVMNNLEDTASVYRNHSDALLKHNYLKIRLRGPIKNPYGIGAKLTVYTPSGIQSKFLYAQRGYLSSVEPLGYFGLGLEDQVDSVTVTWPDHKVSELDHPAINTMVYVEYKDAVQRLPTRKSSPKIFSTSVLGDFTHEENKYEDFRVDPLLPHGITQLGPATSSADINNDGVLDVFIGGSKNKVAYFLLSGGDSYVKQSYPSFETDKKFEDGGAAFVDVDLDGDQDLFVASGGGELGDQESDLSDRLYVYEEGEWIKQTEYLQNSNSAVVKTIDVDLDGDHDLFIGGYFKPADYPYPSASYFLENQNGKLVVNTSWTQSLDHEVVNDASVADMNGDGYPDLVTVGEWSAVMVYINQQGEKFENRSDAYGLAGYTGWWHSLEIVDIDGDGDLDILGGNLGKNSRYVASPGEPLKVYANDFDNNGDNEYIITYFNGGEEWPMPRKDVLMSVVKRFNKDYPAYDGYAKAKVEEIIDTQQAFKREANHTASLLFLHHNGKFTSSELPAIAQFSPIFDFEVLDFNGDGLLDILGVGNRYDADVEQGPYDASKGFLLKNTGDGVFEGVPMDQTGLVVDRNARKLVRRSLDDVEGFLVVNNNDAVQWVRITGDLAE